MRKNNIAVIIGVVLAGVIAIACSSANNDSAEAPRNADTVSSGAANSPKASAVAVTVKGKGEQVKTVELVDSGYTVKYEAASLCLIVVPVNKDGEDGTSIINECARDIDSKKLTGTTTYNADGPVTLHVSNTSGAWTLTFTPLG